MQTLYDHPIYYDIAFSFRDIATEVDVFEESIRRFSRIPVKRVLEIGCGTSPHMEQLIKRGYEYVGIDISDTMLEYSQRKASTMKAMVASVNSVNLVHANMVEFSLEMMVDFAYVMLGSLDVKNTAELVSHFDSVARVLKRGGLYFLDWCIQFDSLSNSRDVWQLERNGIRIKATYSATILNRVEQTFEEVITLVVEDHGQEKTIVEKNIKRAIYPQEFLLFVAGGDDFEFVGWWNNWDFSRPLQRIEGIEPINRPIAIIRRR